MIKIQKRKGKLLLIYNGHMGTEWILEKLKKENEVKIRKSFTFIEEDILPKEKFQDDEFDEFDDIEFILGRKEENYYRHT